MMQAADPGQGNNLSKHWRFDPSRFGGIFFQCQVSPTVTIVAAVFTKDPAQVSLIEHDDVIQTVPANGTDHAFDEWILPRRSARCYHLLDTQALDPSSHSVTIDAIAVTQQISRCGIKWKRLDYLLGYPPSSWVRSYIAVHDLATVMTEDYEHIEHPEGGSRDREEINGDEIRYMVIKECSPSLRRRSLATYHVLRNMA